MCLTLSRPWQCLELDNPWSKRATSDIEQRICIKHTTIQSSLEVFVCRVEVQGPRDLNRTCRDGKGNVVTWTTVPWALSRNESENLDVVETYLGKHAKQHTQTNWPWLESLTQWKQYASLVALKCQEALLLDWKTGSASSKNSLPGDKKIPSDWKSIPDSYALPRLVVSGLNIVFDRFANSLFPRISSELDKLGSSPEDCHVAYAIFRHWFEYHTTLQQDMQRRRNEKALGSEDTSLEKMLDDGYRTLGDRAIKHFNGLDTRYEDIKGLSPEIKELHKEDIGVGYLKPLKELLKDSASQVL